MNPHDLVGIRDEDLDAAEREARNALLERDPEARREHAEARQLEETLGAMPEMGAGPSAAEILRRARAPGAAAPVGVPEVPASGANRAWPVALLLAAAAAVLLVVGLSPGDTTRTRGTGVDAAVDLQAVADGSRVRELEEGSALSPGESVVFHVRTTRPGQLTLVEHGPTGTTEILRWQADAGSAALGGDAPLAWTPDDPAGGERRYVVEWCEDGGGTCVSDALVLHWPPR